jgi:NADH pyrophosphatase NudC (nudix superfamily)
MIGCVATMHEAEIQRQKVTVDHHELDEARWFDVNEVSAMLRRSAQVHRSSCSSTLMWYYYWQWKRTHAAALQLPRRDRRTQERASCTCHRRSLSRTTS